ncbi:MAG: divalent-cation tolerance protein CutA [Candidatus Pacebacteria bacterium]|nr:divalent-cation tolerance protein CutA [Candidatus Paceibacterota bacterium]MBP9716077.1 divalent-cation tolerance protein CutA [Candidatus Paceibacterota bacterium]
MIIDKINKDLEGTVFVYTTCRDRDEARDLARSAVENHMAVCGDFWSVESVYPWHGVLEDVDQYMLMLTTSRELSEKLTIFLGELHSYDVPMFVSTNTIYTSELYRLWMQRTLEEKGKFITPDEESKKEKYEGEGGYHPGKLK